MRLKHLWSMPTSSIIHFPYGSVLNVCPGFIWGALCFLAIVRVIRKVITSVCWCTDKCALLLSAVVDVLLHSK